MIARSQAREYPAWGWSPTGRYMCVVQHGDRDELLEYPPGLMMDSWRNIGCHYVDVNLVKPGQILEGVGASRERLCDSGGCKAGLWTSGSP